MHVVVIGGGIGGLTLAQGLLKQGVSVEVFERDRFAGSRFEGYRIDIEEMGLRALRACLPRANFDSIMSSSYLDDCWGVLNHKLNTLVNVDGDLMWPRPDEIGGHYGIDRPVLRRGLQQGLEGVLHFDAEFVRYDHAPDGRVTAIFKDGRRATGDVLVAADGTKSRLAEQYQPGWEVVDSGFCCVGLKLDLTPETRPWIPPSMSHGVALLMSNNSVFSFNAVFDPPNPAGAQPYVLHALTWDVEAEKADPVGKSDEEVDVIVAEKTANWHPSLRRMFKESKSHITFQLRATKQRPAWSPSNVVLLGDAVHSMPPTAGRGGNTALRDAHLLARELSAAAHGRKNLLDAVATYEADMRVYGQATIDESMKNIEMYSGAAERTMFRAFLRTCRWFPHVRNKVFAGPRGIGARRDWEDDKLPEAA